MGEQLRYRYTALTPLIVGILNMATTKPETVDYDSFGDGELRYNLGLSWRWPKVEIEMSLRWLCVEKCHVVEEGLFLDKSGSVMTTLNIDMDGMLYLGLWGRIQEMQFTRDLCGGATRRL